MHPLTELTPGYFCIEVPEEAMDIDICCNKNNYSLEYTMINENNTDGYDSYHLEGKGEFKLLGIVNADSIDFNTNKIFDNDFEDHFILLYELLASKGLYWVVQGEEPELKNYSFGGIGIGRTGITFPQNGYNIEKYNNDYKAWQAAESKRITGKLVVLKLLK